MTGSDTADTAKHAREVGLVSESGGLGDIDDPHILPLQEFSCHLVPASTKAVCPIYYDLDQMNWPEKTKTTRPPVKNYS